MYKPNLTIREITCDDIPLITEYWLSADEKFMKGMGVDLKKIPSAAEWKSMLEEQLSSGYEHKKSYCLIWEEDGKAIGHSNINKIRFGEEAYMHLHIWKSDSRKKGRGTALIRMGLPFFFNKLRLKRIYCEPYALNPAPNKTLQKAGFTFLKSYTCVPGWINFEQEVNLWEMTEENFRKT